MPWTTRTRGRQIATRGDHRDYAGDVVIWSSWGHFIIIDVEVLRQTLAAESRQTKIEWDEQVDRLRVVNIFRRAIRRSTVRPPPRNLRENDSLHTPDTSNFARVAITRRRLNSS